MYKTNFKLSFQLRQTISFVLNMSFIALVFAGFACERKTAETGKIVIQLPQKQTQIDNIISGITTFASGPDPIDWSYIDCVAFMVSGPETSLRQNKCDLMSGFTGEKTDSLYYGSIFAGYYQGASAELEIPSGTDRVITAIGFKTNMTAAIGAEAACKNILKSEHENFSKAFVMATSDKLKIEPGSTQTVNMPITYVANSTPFLDECSGPSSPGNGDTQPAKGPPVRLVMRVQDNLQEVFQHSCVAVSFELLDANGQLAEVTDYLSFNVSDANSFARFDTIDNRCESAGLASPNIEFYGPGQKLNRVIKFLRMTGTGTINFIIVPAAPAALPTIVIEQPSLVVMSAPTPSPNPPYFINMFDIYSFRSSKSTTASTPIDVQAGECRPMLVQLIDSMGYPVKVVNQAALGGQDIESTVSILSTAAGFAGLSSSSACAAPAPTNVKTVFDSSESKSGLNFFYYQVPTGFAGQRFNFKVLVQGAQYYSLLNSIYDLDPTSAMNSKSFWKIKN